MVTAATAWQRATHVFSLGFIFQSLSVFLKSKNEFMETIIKQEWLINPNITSENHRDIAKCLELGLKYPSNLLGKSEYVSEYSLFYDHFTCHRIPYIWSLIDNEDEYIQPSMNNGEVYIGSSTVFNRILNATILLIPQGEDYDCILEDLKEWIIKENYLDVNIDEIKIK